MRLMGSPPEGRRPRAETAPRPGRGDLPTVRFHASDDSGMLADPRNGAGVGYARLSKVMHSDTQRYNESQVPDDQAICRFLAEQIDLGLPEAENKIWHAFPVWFLDGNPIVGYSKLKGCVRLLFWSGQSFAEPGLVAEGTFKAAEARFTAVAQVDSARLARWLAEARDVQWDYKNLVRRKGRLERLR
jgi:hypothetical protein